MAYTTINASKIAYNYGSFKLLETNFLEHLTSISLTSAVTLTSQTAAQPLFKKSVNLDSAGTYHFECNFALSSLSGATGSIGFSIGATSPSDPSMTFSQYWIAQAGKGSTVTSSQLALSDPHVMYTTWNTAANTKLTVETACTNAMVSISGYIRCTAPCTVTPKVSMTTAAAATVAVGSSFNINYVMGATSVTQGSPGAWSNA